MNHNLLWKTGLLISFRHDYNSSINFTSNSEQEYKSEKSKEDFFKTDDHAHEEDEPEARDNDAVKQMIMSPNRLPEK